MTHDEKHAINRDYFNLKNSKFSAEKFNIFLIFAQNIDCGYRRF